MLPCDKAKRAWEEEMPKKRRSSLQPFQRKHIAQRRKLAALREEAQDDGENVMQDVNEQQDIAHSPVSCAGGLLVLYHALADSIYAAGSLMYSALIHSFSMPIQTISQIVLGSIYFLSFISRILMEYVILVPFSFWGSFVRSLSERREVKQFETVIARLEKVRKWFACKSF